MADISTIELEVLLEQLAKYKDRLFALSSSQRGELTKKAKASIGLHIKQIDMIINKLNADTDSQFKDKLIKIKGKLEGLLVRNEVNLPHQIGRVLNELRQLI